MLKILVQMLRNHVIQDIFYLPTYTADLPFYTFYPKLWSKNKTVYRSNYILQYTSRESVL
jgi:hypothetical protein